MNPHKMARHRGRGARGRAGRRRGARVDRVEQSRLGRFSDVAKRLGISQDKLEDAIKEATIARIDAAVAAGDITKEEGDALRERVLSDDLPPSCRASAIGAAPRRNAGSHADLATVCRSCQPALRKNTSA